MSSYREQQHTSLHIFLFIFSRCIDLKFVGHVLPILNVLRVCQPVCQSPYTILPSYQKCLWGLVSLLSCNTCYLFDCSMGWVLIVVAGLHFPNG